MRVIFSKPNVAGLRKEGYTPIDMHVHTDASSDCKVSLQSILKKAKEMGIGIAITDHDKIDSAVKAVSNNMGVLVIPGIEVFTKSDRHVLFYFYNKRELVRFHRNEVKNQFLNKDVDDFLKLKHKYRCIAGIAHPTGHEIWHNYGINYNIRNVDFLEVLNGCRSKNRAIELHELAKRYKTGIVGGSDAHVLEEIGNCVMCSKGKSVKEAIESVKKKKNLVVGLPISGKKVVRRLPGGIFRLGLWVLAKIYYYSGIKSLVRRHLVK